MVSKILGPTIWFSTKSYLGKLLYLLQNIFFLIYSVIEFE